MLHLFAMTAQLRTAKMYNLMHAVGLVLALISPVCSAQRYYGPQDPRVEDALTLEHVSRRQDQAMYSQALDC